MLEVNLQVVEKHDTDVREALKLIPKLFSLPTLCLTEATDKARLFLLSEQEFEAMAADTWWERCFSFIVCDEKAELRVEKTPFETPVSFRVLREVTGEGEAASVFKVRKSSYILRQQILGKQHAELKLEDCGASYPRVQFHEYFQPDEYGWLVRKQYRFAGLGDKI